MAGEGTLAPTDADAIRDRAADPRGFRRRGGRSPPDRAGQGVDRLGSHARIQAGRPAGTTAARSLRPCPNRGGSRNGPPWHAPRSLDGIPTVIVGGVKDEPSVSGKSPPRAFPGSDVLLRHNGLYTSGEIRAPQPRGVVVKHSGLWNPRRQFESARGYLHEVLGAPHIGIRRPRLGPGRRRRGGRRR